MIVKPKNVDELLDIIHLDNGKHYFLAGGTDINILIKKRVITDEKIIYINHLKDLKKIKRENGNVFIGALSTYKDVFESDIMKRFFPFLLSSLEHFASPLIQTLATVGGNIANGSPTNDISPLLLVLNAKLKIISQQNERIVYLKDFYTGYKKNILKNNEIIAEIIIAEDAENDYITYYKKVASRNILAISKLSLAGLKKVTDDKIEKIKIAVGSLNEYPRRLFKLEEYLKNKSINQIDFTFLRKILTEEITPISDFRSDKKYRFEVCQNLITEFLAK